MKSKKLYLFLGLFVTIVSAGACGQAAQVVPTIDSSARETSLAGTALAFGTATPTPAPTKTPVPTPKISVYGTSLIIQADQSALFIDHKAGIQLTIPVGWLPVRVNEEEYYKAFTLDVAVANQPITDRLTQIQTNNFDYFRLDAIDIRPDHILEDLVPVMSVLFQPDDFRTLEQWDQLQRSKKLPLKNYTFISSKYQKTADGTRVLVSEARWDAPKAAVVYIRSVFFSIPAGTVILDFQSNMDFKDLVLPEFEQLVNSLTLLNP